LLLLFLLLLLLSAVILSLAVTFLPIKELRHLDRSCSQPYREQRSGETPAFRFAFVFALPGCHPPQGTVAVIQAKPPPN
jgi:hypothetical protein